MLGEVGKTRRTELVGEDDHVCDAELAKVRKRRSFGERVKGRRFAIVTLGNETRVAVDQRMPETRGRQHAIDVVEGFAARWKWKTRHQRVIGVGQAVEDRRQPI